MNDRTSLSNDSVIASDKISNPLLKILYSDYSSRHKSNAQVSTHKFHPANLAKNQDSEYLELIAEQKQLSNLNDRNDYYVLVAILNGFAKSGLLERDREKYTFTEKGYKLAFKLSNPLKYILSYHYIWAVTCFIAALGVIATLLTIK